MATFILTWNPADYPWNERDEEARDVQHSDVCHGSWTCGRTKRIASGDRVFLLRQGQDQPGIVASGYASAEPRWDENWNAFHVKVDWDVILPSKSPILNRKDLLDRVQIKAGWAQRSSGQTPHDPLCVGPRSGPHRCVGTCMAGTLEKVWAGFLNSIR
jgi:hypothetical protein